MRKGGSSRWSAAAVALVGALCLLSAPALAADPAPTSPPVGEGGGWSYFSDPRAVQVTSPRKLLYSGWVTRLGNIVAGVYDPATQRVQTMVLQDRLENDDHVNPSVLALPDGRVSYFWSAHNGTAMYYRSTTVPGDIRSFGPLRTLPVHPSGDRLYTYTNPVLLPAEGNRLYLFWRSQYSHQAFATSDDLGEHWSAAKVLLEEPGQRPYVKYAANADTIAIAFTRSHPDESSTGIYYMSYWRDAFFRADGTAIGGTADLPFAPAQTELVVSTATLGGSAWIQDVALLPDGRPVIVYVTTGALHVYHYVRWDGLRWQDTVLADAGPGIVTGREPSYTGGITLDHSDPNVAYLSRRVGSYNVVEKWQTSDGGTTFTSTALPQDLTVDNLRPVVPRGLGPDDTVRTLWMSGTYRYFTDFTTSIVGAPTAASNAEVTSIRVAPVPTAVREGTVVRTTARLFSPITAHPAGALEVTLFERQAGGLAWSRVGTSRTDHTGLVSFGYRIQRSTELRIDWPGDDRWTPVSTRPLRITATSPVS